LGVVLVTRFAPSHFSCKRLWINHKKASGPGKDSLASGSPVSSDKGLFHPS
jgi:hypothetical protein